MSVTRLTEYLHRDPRARGPRALLSPDAGFEPVGASITLPGPRRVQVLHGSAIPCFSSPERRLTDTDVCASADPAQGMMRECGMEGSVT